MKGLTEDQRDVLREINEEQYKVVLEVVQLLIRKQEYSVLSYNIAKDPQGLVLLRAQLDGARILADGIGRAKRELTKEK